MGCKEREGIATCAVIGEDGKLVAGESCEFATAMGGCLFGTGKAGELPVQVAVGKPLGMATPAPKAPKRNPVEA